MGRYEAIPDYTEWLCNLEITSSFLLAMTLLSPLNIKKSRPKKAAFFVCWGFIYFSGYEIGRVRNSSDSTFTYSADTKQNLLPAFIGSLPARNYKSKRDYKYTIAKDNHLYIEIYRASVINNSVVAYLTDSLTFSQNLGQYDDEKGYIDCKLQGDSIITQRKDYAVENGKQSDSMKTIGVKVYSLRALKVLHNFNR